VLERFHATLVKGQYVLAFTGPADEIFRVPTAEGLILLSVGEDESPALAVDVTGCVSLGPIAAELFPGDAVVMPG